MTHESYISIVRHYESCLEEYGDTHRGHDWPRADDVDVRHAVMLDVVLDHRAKPVTLLDFGCGTSPLLEFIRKKGLQTIIYEGLDMSPKFVKVAQGKFPEVKYWCLDILKNDRNLPMFDYVVLNGVITEKRELPVDRMWTYVQKLLKVVFAHVKIGMAFNVMTKHVDWEREDLFHLPFDTLAEFMKRELTRNFVFRSDYGLYEYTTYVYRDVVSLSGGVSGAAP